MSRTRSELTRKAVHVSMGGFALLLRWLGPWQAAGLALAALLFNVFVLHRLTRRALLREGERKRGFSWGIALYPAVVLVLVGVFHRRLELAAAVWALLAFGDGMATVAGVTWGLRRLPWNREKSWAGLIAFVVCGTLSAAFLLRWTQRAVIDQALGGTTGAAGHVGRSFMAGNLADGVLPDAAFLLLGCFVAALVAALAESLDTGIDDNVLVPLAGGATLYAATLVEAGRLVAAAPQIGMALAVGASINALLAVAAFASRGVSRSGALAGWLLGTLLYGFGGWRGFLMLLVFFVLGTASTKLGYARKAAAGLAQDRGGRRGARNAFANTAAGVIFALLGVAGATPRFWTVALVAAFATATFDTVSSELGQLWGRRHFLVTTFRRVRAGTDGAVSIEGTLAGLVAALLLAGSAWAVGSIGLIDVGIVGFAAFVGATFESYLGATVERSLRLDNELVNFVNTVVGGLVAGLLYTTVAVFI